MYLSLVAIAVIIVAALVIDRNRRRRSRLPPGPKGLPLVGNILDVPKSHEWIKYAEWSKQYGSDMIYLNLAGAPVIVVHSAETAIDLFEKRSSIYSDRGRQVMLNELVGFEYNIAFMPYGDWWRENRRVFHQHFNPNAILKYRPKSTREGRLLLGRLLEAPEGFMEHFRHMAGSLILSVTYGIDVLPKDDPYIETAEEALHALASTGNAGAYLVDVLPFLKHVPSWFPGAGFKQKAAEWRKPTIALKEAPFAYVKQSMSKGQVNHSIAASLLETLDNTKDNTKREQVFRNATGTAYIGGADTSVSALGTFVLAMLLYPEAQNKAREELDRVVGSDRLPEYEDEADLPYITAILRESMRWQLVTPLAVPHRLTRDDEYKGYCIPKGTLVVGNAWAILHDETYYPDPETFNPDRFLTADGRLDPAVPNPERFAFGFGRRICPGRYLSMSSVWLTIASILSTFEIVKVKDEHGKYIEPSGEYTTGLISYPVPFKCTFKPRSPDAEVLIRASIREAA